MPHRTGNVHCPVRLLVLGIGVKEGDYITAIDGISTATVDNIYSLLAGKANVLTELSICHCYPEYIEGLA